MTAIDSTTDAYAGQQAVTEAVGEVVDAKVRITGRMIEAGPAGVVVTQCVDPSPASATASGCASEVPCTEWDGVVSAVGRAPADGAEDVQWSTGRPKPLLGHLSWRILHCSSVHSTWHATRLEGYGTAKVDTAIYRRASSDRSIHLMKTAHSVMGSSCYP
jgi:hypothetical protein